MNEKLVALALIRAALTEDLEALHVIATENPPTPELMASLVSLAAGMLHEGCGPERAIAAVDGWLRSALDSATRARDPR